jgi:hypothetical protein
MQLPFILLLAEVLYLAQGATAAPFLKIPFLKETVARRTAECQFDSAVCTPDRAFAAYSQRPLRFDFATPPYSSYKVLNVEGRQLLPTSGDDFWFGGSG